MPTRLTYAQQAVALLRLTKDATPFFSHEGQPCASIPNGLDSDGTGSRSVVPLRSANFRDWLTSRYFSEHETAPSDLALRAVPRTLEARAHGESSPQKVGHRVSFEGDPFAPSKVFVDLANDMGEIVEINSQGWSTAENLRHPFRQSPSMLSLPAPQSQTPNPGPSLFELFHLTSDARTRVLFWLCAALRPVGPYPILVLRGPAGSGKSTFARALRTLIDPSIAALRRLPNTDRELLHYAHNNWVLVFDQVHRIPIKISEALCAVSSGEAIETLQPDYRDPAVAEIARPIILIAPLDEAQPAWIPTRSLANRTLTVDLPPIEKTRPEAAFWSDFEAFRAPFLAVLADAVSSALRRIRDVEAGHILRFSDSVAWAIAAGPVLDLDPTAIAAAVSDPESIWIGTDPLRDTLYALLRPIRSWSGDSAMLLTRLRSIAPFATLPSTSKALGQALPRIPAITISKSGRVLTISKSDLQIASSPPPNP